MSHNQFTICVFLLRHTTFAIFQWRRSPRYIGSSLYDRMDGGAIQTREVLVDLLSEIEQFKPLVRVMKLIGLAFGSGIFLVLA